jgi:hypothetical protein
VGKTIYWPIPSKSCCPNHILLDVSSSSRKEAVTDG